MNRSKCLDRIVGIAGPASPSPAQYGSGAISMCWCSHEWEIVSWVGEGVRVCGLKRLSWKVVSTRHEIRTKEALTMEEKCLALSNPPNLLP